MAKWIMVVDDDVANLKMAGAILSKNNMRVTALKSGKALLDYICEHGTPDLILLDIMMPEMDGFETLKNLRELEKKKSLSETPVIFLTADANTGTESKGFEVGVSDYIRKPFNPEVLLRRIDNVISMQSEMENLKNEASVDKLTGFMNKAATTTEFSKLCAQESGCLMMIDLDSFKLVNDLYGHEMGDKVLISFANIIRETLPEGSKYGRIGGDEFTAFCVNTDTEEAVVEITKALNEKLVKKAKELMGPDMNIPLGTSVGGIMVPIHGNDYGSLLKLADKSLYKVKKNGKHGCALYSSDFMEDDNEGNGLMDIRGISEILGERNIHDDALFLDMDAFAHVYRYSTRYFMRNGVNVLKVLFTLERLEGASDSDYKNKCDEFGNHVRKSLRKSDMLTRSRYNQYFVLIPDIREEHTEMVVNSVIKKWNDNHGGILDISYETEFVRRDEIEPYSDGRASVVIVDDDIININSAVKALSEHDVNVTPFLSGAEFLEYISMSEKLPLLILLDIKMKDMDGFAIMDKLKAMGGDISRVPVIFLTADDSEGNEVVGLSKGAVDYIKKPFTPEILNVRVNHILELAVLRKRYSDRRKV
ncbi:MAG: response regulator [Lachnospiraceae bacterium]|nr:response regulator [Lachnospiraceae bacterium]